jgi:radical SAM protein with 4Fe4S-binding SPASM domain
VVDARPLIEEAGFSARSVMGAGKSFRVFSCMADGGSVAICPDGALYPCEHLPQEARFGDIWHGVTDEAARYNFCRVDRTQEKCRSCPFLPDCTSFSSCPVRDIECRKVHELMALDSLKRMAEKKENEIIEGETPVC